MAWTEIDLKKSYVPQLFEALRKGESDAPPLAGASKNLYYDTLVNAVHNKYAYNQYKDKPGIHVRADLNDFGEVNAHHGMEEADKALKHFGKLSAQVAAEFNGKAFRYGGDEFHYYFGKPEDAHMFCRKLRALLEHSPKVGQKHNISASFGIADTSEKSELAMRHAKEQLRMPDGTKKYEPGEAPNVFYSMFALGE